MDNHNSENDCKLEKYEEKFGQFAKKREITMKLVPTEATILGIGILSILETNSAVVTENLQPPY